MLKGQKYCIFSQSPQEGAVREYTFLIENNDFV